MIIWQENPGLVNIETKNIVHCTWRPKYDLLLAPSNHHKSSHLVKCYQAIRIAGEVETLLECVAVLHYTYIAYSCW